MLYPITDITYGSEPPPERNIPWNFLPLFKINITTATIRWRSSAIFFSLFFQRWVNFSWWALYFSIFPRFPYICGRYFYYGFCALPAEVSIAAPTWDVWQVLLSIFSCVSVFCPGFTFPESSACFCWWPVWQPSSWPGRFPLYTASIWPPHSFCVTGFIFLPYFFSILFLCSYFPKTSFWSQVSG